MIALTVSSLGEFEQIAILTANISINLELSPFNIVFYEL